MAAFGELLSELRKDKGMTQGDLAKILHVSVSTISNYEQGVHYPDIDKLLDMADFFQVTTDYLLGRCDSNLSVDIFGETLIGPKTVGDVIRELHTLSEERRNALAIMLSDMTFHTTIERYREKDGR